LTWQAAGRGDILKAMRALDAAHLALMLLALTLAYVVPFELLLFAYVVLGPAHYATEISWLHDRKYFVPHHAVALALAAVAILIAFIDSASWSGFIIWSTLVVCALIVIAKSGVQVMLLLAGAAALTFIMYLNAPWLGVIGILLPTLIHVSLFTLIFMALGALRSRSAFQGALIAVYIAAILLIVLAPPSAATAIPIFATAAKTYFGNVAPALSHVFRVRGLTLDGRLTGLLAFVYTYHYLNWFIKAEVIRWTNIPRSRLALVAGASAASTALYFYDYTIGFAVLLAFSLLHVVLEFPLNALAARQLGGALWEVARPKRPLRAGTARRR
jgi:hypothetical protein